MNNKNIVTFVKTITLSMADKSLGLTSGTSFFVVDLLDLELEGVIGLNESAIPVSSESFYCITEVS